ncbi:MAG: TonB-dependent receptor [Mucilaginibacter sp.]|uniref:SusC/RagA family TonB-linked outer membrane protein n=1 Tax=Mucilaginibacter sp. TaxID=1882438 RepID=UPI0032678E78
MKRSLPGEPEVYSFKLKRILMTLLLLTTICSFTKAGAYTFKLQQSTEVSGRITDRYGKALVDVNVQNLTAQKATITSIDGQYKIDANKGDTLVLTLKGFATQQFIIADKFELNVVMNEARSALDTNYNVLYQSQKRALSVQAVSQIGSEELQKSTSPSFNGLLAGRIAGLYSSQLTGEPGNDNVTLSLRGVSPLVLIDGVPQNFTYINPEMVESVTVLKDALSTAMLGIRGSGGAIQITTKRGAEGPQRISFTATSGVQQAIKRPQFLNAYNYASLYNEALVNDGKAPVYTQQDLDLYKNGTDPLGHPDIDWQNQVLNKQSPYQRYDLAITGGRKAARYFVNLDYMNQEGPFKTESFNTYNTNSGLQRYTLSSNIDIDFNKYLSTSLHLYGQILNGNDPGATAVSIFSNLIATPNGAYPVKNPDGSLAGTEDYQSNIYGQTVLTGYRPYTSSNFNVDLSLKGNLDPVLKGLWVKGLAALSNKLLESINRSKSPLVYQLSGVNTTGQNVYSQYGTISDQVNTTAYSGRQRLFYTELSAGYSYKMKNSGIDALVLTSDDSRMIDDQLVSNLVGVSGRLSYNYKEKYLAEVAVGYNGSERYPENHRYGFFPAVGLGWVISKEDFLKSTTWLNNLKLRASYGKTGNSNAGYFDYNQYYETGTAYNFGNTSSSAPAIRRSDIANADLSWEKANKLNIGIDATLFNNTLSVTAEYYNNKYYDLLLTPGYATAVAGFTYPLKNIGVNRNTGFELQLMYQNKAGSFNYFIAPNIAFSQSKVIFQDEVYRPYAYMLRTGMPVGQQFGYIADGLFQSNAEAKSSPVPVGANPIAGDIKYRDLNGDGKIDQNDQTAIGSTSPIVFYGLYLGFNVKGFDLSALLQGVENRNLMLTGNTQWEFQANGRGQAYANNLNRWTPQTAATATYPRVSIGANYNNQQTSSYWLHSGDYMRLKNVEIGYTLPVLLTKKVGLASFRIFVNGTNILTRSDVKNVDPEGYDLSLYPVQKTFIAGVNVKF